MKKMICAVLAVCIGGAVALSGCGSVSGIDGRNGQDLNIYDIYEAANAARAEAGESQLDFLEFLKEYLHYDFEYSQSEVLQTVINRSLLSAVAVISGFTYTSRWGLTDVEYYAGSGVIVDIDKNSGDAYIVTNCHIVYDAAASAHYATSVSVYLYGNDDYSVTSSAIEAEIVGASISYDLALLKVEGSEAIKSAKAATFAEGEEVYAGTSVFAVGNPNGDGLSVTTGIISKDSELIELDITEGYGSANEYRVIRTDAAINGGNSGGGLFDSSGRLVGIINSKVISDEIDNMGYALCGSYAKRLWKLMRDGYTARNQTYGLRHAIFPASYSYTSSAYFDNELNVTRISDKVVVTLSSDGLETGDVIQAVRAVDTSGTVVDSVQVPATII